MKAVEGVHPAPEQLRAFAMGQLDPARQDEIASHIAGCDACCQVLRQAGEDTFLKRVRQAAPHQPTEADSPAPRAAALPVDVPAELADHPRYRITARLGEGGMGTVYKAEHRIMERIVALKVISPHLVSNPKAAERFHQEVKAAAKLSHPNIVAAHDADQAGSLHFLVMEYVEGISLARLVEKKGPLAVAHACSFARQTALGLQHAHDQGMIHRDIKPHNLMVTRKGQVKILDFGLARFATTRGDSETKPAAKGLTEADVVLGTPDFLSPEQARDSRSVDSRADLYSLGCTLYYLLTGQVPFPGGSSLQKLFAQAEEEAAPIEQLRSGIPEGLANVVRKLMAKKPVDRYQTAAEAAAALVPYTRPSGAAPTMDQPAAVLTEDAPIEVFPLPDEEESGGKTQRIGADALEETPPQTPKKRKPPRRRRRLSWKHKLLIGAGAFFWFLVLMAAIDGMKSRPTDEGAEPGSKETGKPRVLYVLASQGFFYPDYGPVAEELKRGGAEVKVASTTMQPAQTKPFGGGLSVKPDLLLADAKPADFDAVIFCGGPGAVEEYANKPSGAGQASRFIEAMLSEGKPVGALCHASVVLAEAGVLRGKQATCFPMVKWRVERGKATVQDVPVVRDGLIITARDDKAGVEFAREMLKALRMKR